MSREQRLKQFLDSVDAKFKAHNNESSFVESMKKIDQYKTENARSAKARQEAASQFRIKFDALPLMPLSQTKVDQAKIPELANHWNEQTVGFVSSLAARARTLAEEKSVVEKELSMSKEQIKSLQNDIASKQTKSVGDLQKQVDELTETNASLTAENESVKKEVSSLNAKMVELNAQIAGHDAELKTMTDILEEKQRELDAATGANKELIGQGETNAKLIADHKLTNESLSTQLETLKSEFAALSSANQSLLLELETKRTVESDNIVLKGQIVTLESNLLEKDANVTVIQSEMDNKIKQIENQYKIENAKAKIFHDMEKDLLKQQHGAAIEKQVQEITKNSSSTNAELTTKISALEQEHKIALEALEENKAVLSELENAKAIETSNANAENDSLKTQNAELEAAKQACETQRKQLQEAKQACDEKTALLEAANAVCEEQRKQLQEANDVLKTELDSNNTRIKEIDEQISALTAEKIILQQTNSEQAGNHASRIKALEREKEGIKGQNANLNEALKTLSAEHEELKKQFGVLEQTYNESTQELQDAKASNETTAEQLQALIAAQTASIAEAKKKEQELNTRFEIDACLINNSIESLQWTDWQNAKEYFVGKYGNVDQIEELQSITGLQSQIDAIGASTTLDGLVESFGMLKNILSSLLNNSSVEPTCINSLTDLIIAFLNSQKQIQDIRNQIAQKEETERIEKEKYESLLKEQTDALELFKTLNDNVEMLQGKIKATEGENLKFTEEKNELNNDIKDLKMRLISQNVNLNASQKEEMTKLLNENQNANATIGDLTEELNKIKEELEAKEESLKIANTDAETRKTQFDELTEKIETQNSTISQLTNEVHAITNANTQLRKVVEEKDESKIGLTLKINDIENTNKMLTAKLNALKIQKEEILTDTGSQLDELKTANKDLQSQIDTNQHELDALKDADVENKQQIDALTSDATTNQAKIEELTKTNEANELKMQTMIKQINTLSGELTANKTTIERLKGELDEKTNELERVNAQLQELRTNTSAIEQALKDLQSANAAQKLEHDQAIIKAKEEYDEALAAAKADAGTAANVDLDVKLAEAKAELDKQLLEAKAELGKQLAEAKAELEIKLAEEAKADLEKQLEAANSVCDKKIQELQNRELKLAKELLFLKLQLDLKKQQALNYKPVYVPPSTTTYTPSTPTVVKKDRIVPRQKIDLKGGAKNKSKIFMKGGSYNLLDYDEDYEIVVVFNNKDYSTIGQYPAPATDDDYVVHCTEKEIKDYNIRTQDLKTEIETLKKELEGLKNSTQICAFVNKMAPGSGASAKLMKELVLMKTHASMNANKFLFEKIANKANQTIISQLKNKIDELHTKIASMGPAISSSASTALGGPGVASPGMGGTGMGGTGMGGTGMGGTGMGGPVVASAGMGGPVVASAGMGGPGMGGSGAASAVMGGPGKKGPVGLSYIDPIASFTKVK